MKIRVQLRGFCGLIPRLSVAFAISGALVVNAALESFVMRAKNLIA